MSMAKMRERFDDGFLREGGLAASLGGALVGGFAGNKVGKSRLTTIAGAAAGALGAKTLAERREKYVDLHLPLTVP
jgi:outer membrane lipoprotein SlyB